MSHGPKWLKLAMFVRCMILKMSAADFWNIKCLYFYVILTLSLEAPVFGQFIIPNPTAQTRMPGTEGQGSLVFFANAVASSSFSGYLATGWMKCFKMLKSHMCTFMTELSQPYTISLAVQRIFGRQSLSLGTIRKKTHPAFRGEDVAQW